MAVEIVKVQRSLTMDRRSPSGMSMGLVYAEGRDRLLEQAIPELGDDAKGYFEAVWSPIGWIIGKRVEARDW